MAILGGCQQATIGSAQSAGTNAVPAAAPSAVPSRPVAPAGTAVGARAQELRAQAQELSGTIDGHLERLRQIRQERDAAAGQYYAVIGEIDGKLRTGTTPSNPILMAKWTEARGLLDKLEGNLSQVTALSNDMAIDGQTGAYLENSTRAVFVMPGAVDEDHAQLRALEAEVAASDSKVSGELIEVTNEINRQNAALGVERNNLATLAEAVSAPAQGNAGKAAAQQPKHRHHGNKATPPSPAPSAAPEAAASAPSGNASAQVAPGVEATPLAAPAKSSDKRAAKSAHGASPAHAKAALPHGALMVIRFDGYQARYEEALYRAVSHTLAQQPNAKFRIVGVSPEAAQPDDTASRLGDVRRHVDDVQRSLLAFGLAPARISASSETNRRTPVEEIRIYRQ